MSNQPPHIWIRPITDSAFRITASESAAGGLPPDRPWVKDVFPGLFEEIQPPSSLTFKVSDGAVEISSPDRDFHFQEIQPVQFLKNGSLKWRFRLEPNEIFFGGGEWFNRFARKKGKINLSAHESPEFSQYHQTYSTIPLFYSSRGFAIFLLNSNPSTWNIQPQKRILEISAAGGSADWIFFYGPSLKQILQQYTALTGRPPLIPRWGFGLWATSYPQEHQNRVEEVAHAHQEHHIPLDAIILDYHWEEHYHNFQWRKSLFPQPDQMIRNLLSKGIKTGLIFTPFENNRNLPLQKRALNLIYHNLPGEAHRDDERDLPGYTEALTKGYFAHPNTRWWFGSGGMIDFTHPDACHWWGSRLKPLYDQGIAFFKNDDGEYLPDDSKAFIGMDGREYHNLYGFYYGRAIAEGMGQLDNRRPLIYGRSVWAGSQRYPALFLGDQKPNFRNIRRTMRAGLNMSLMGFAYWTADIFGLGGKTTPETHIRYAQWALFNPIARYFWRPPHIDPTRFPWSHNMDVEENFRFYTNLRYHLLPTYQNLAWEAHLTGIPIIRPLILEFNELTLADVDDQFMLGSALMFTPVCNSRVQERQVVLPEGTWYDFWSTKEWSGKQVIDVAAPLDRLPIFIRGGQIVTTSPEVIENTAQYQTQQYQFDIYPPFPAETVLFEDDGLTTDYLKGDYGLTRLRVEGDEDTIHFRIEPEKRYFPPKSASKTFRLIFHAVVPPIYVLIDGNRINEWSYSSESRTLSLELHIDPERGLSGEILLYDDPIW